MCINTSDDFLNQVPDLDPLWRDRAGSILIVWRSLDMGSVDRLRHQCDRKSFRLIFCLAVFTAD